MGDSLARRTLAEVLKASNEAHTQDMHVGLPGRIVSYDAAKQTADVECGVRLPLKGEFGEVVYEEFPIFPDVPIAWPRGGGFFITFPLAPEDPVFLVFSDVPMGEYLTTGKVSDPMDTRRHSSGYPMAIPGGASPDPKALTDASATKLVLGKDGATVQISIDGTTIQLGKGTADYLALATKVDNAIEALRVAVNGVGGALGPLPSVASTIVKGV